MRELTCSVPSVGNGCKSEGRGSAGSRDAEDHCDIWRDSIINTWLFFLIPPSFPFHVISRGAKSFSVIPYGFQNNRLLETRK